MEIGVQAVSCPSVMEPTLSFGQLVSLAPHQGPLITALSFLPQSRPLPSVRLPGPSGAVYAALQRKKHPPDPHQKVRPPSTQTLHWAIRRAP